MHSAAHFRFEKTSYSMCDDHGLSVYVSLETLGVLDQRVVVDLRIIGGTATGMCICMHACMHDQLLPKLCIHYIFSW